MVTKKSAGAQRSAGLTLLSDFFYERSKAWQE